MEVVALVVVVVVVVTAAVAETTDNNGDLSNKINSITANVNHMVIGQLVYDVLDDNQKSLFRRLTMSPEIWS